MDKQYKKKLIIICVGIVICIVGLTVCMIFSKIISKKDSNNNQHIVNSVEEEKIELVVDGIGNLYFIPIAKHSDFIDNLSSYLSLNGIRPIGPITQIGDVIADEKSENFSFYLAFNTSDGENYLKGNYNIKEKKYAYAKTDINNVPNAVNAAVCSVDEQEAPDIEISDDTPVNITNINDVSEILTTEQSARLQVEMLSWLKSCKEMRREISIDEDSITKDNETISFVCVFISNRHDNKNIKVVYQVGNGFTFKLT